MLLGSLLGGGIGGLFGHKDNQAAMPDKYASGYGQELADLQGNGLNGFQPMTANGQQFTEGSQLASTLGGQGEAEFITNFIKNNAAMAQTLFTPEELREFTGLGTTAANGPISNGKDGNFQLSNGVNVNWQTLVQNAQDALTRIGNAGQSTSGSGATAMGITPDQLLNTLVPSFSSLDAATQDFIKQILGMSNATTLATSAMRQANDPSGIVLNPNQSGALKGKTRLPVGGFNGATVLDQASSAVANAVASIAPAMISTANIGSTLVNALSNVFSNTLATRNNSVSVTQNNSIGSLAGSSLDHVDDVLGRRLEIMTRTNAWSY
jgi:hypothetical protein